MATARLTFAQAWSLYRQIVNAVNYHFHATADGTALQIATKNYTSLETAITDVILGPRRRELNSLVDAMRSDNVSFLLRAQRALQLCVIEMARSDEVDSPAGDDVDRAFRDTWLYMHNNSQWVRRRFMSFGSTAASGSPVGTGVWYRVTTDAKGYTIESPQADVFTAKCLFDKRTGTVSGQELFELRGQAAGRDILEQLGVGRAVTLAASSEDNGILDSAGFEGTFETSGTTLLGNWQCTSAANFSRNTSTFFRGEGACQIDAADTLYQDITNVTRSVPYFMCIRYKQNNAVGTLAFSVGASAASSVVWGGAAAGSWTDLYIPLTQASWPDVFIQNVTRFTVQWTKTSGAPLIDSCIMRPMFEFNGSYHVITAGATDWKVDDAWTVTDSSTNIGVIQFWTKLLLGRYWPHKPTGSYNITDPTLNVT